MPSVSSDFFNFVFNNYLVLLYFNKYLDSTNVSKNNEFSIKMLLFQIGPILVLPVAC